MNSDFVLFNESKNNMENNTDSCKHYQSTFARSIVFENFSATNSSDSNSFGNDKIDKYDYMTGCSPVFVNVSKSANIISPIKSFNEAGNNNRSPIEVSKYKQDLPDQLDDVELRKLKMKCQNLTEENKKLQILVSQNTNASILQSEIDSLQWQLRQTESSRQMYRTVMEQVSKFLDRVHKNLDVLSSRMSSSKSKTKRFPRSRSVHTMAGTCASNGNNSYSSRCSSPSPTHYSTISNSSQITYGSTIDRIHELDTSPQHSLNSTFAEYCWKPSLPVPEYVTLEKLSQESFRFHRTIQSLLNTADILQRLTPAPSETMLHRSNEKMDNASVGSCGSLYQETFFENFQSIEPSSSTCYDHYTTDGVGLKNAVMKTTDVTAPKGGSIEDESGFSSMSSFHDGNIGYAKLGLPIVECEQSKQKHWSSTPVHKMYDSNASVSFCDNEILRVLWV